MTIVIPVASLHPLCPCYLWLWAYGLSATPSGVSWEYNTSKEGQKFSMLAFALRPSAVRCGFLWFSKLNFCMCADSRKEDTTSMESNDHILAREEPQRKIQPHYF